jgi:hypothetical protein
MSLPPTRSPAAFLRAVQEDPSNPPHYLPRELFSSTLLIEGQGPWGPTNNCTGSAWPYKTCSMKVMYGKVDNGKPPSYSAATPGAALCSVLHGSSSMMPGWWCLVRCLHAGRVQSGKAAASCAGVCRSAACHLAGTLTPLCTPLLCTAAAATQIQRAGGRAGACVLPVAMCLSRPSPSAWHCQAPRHSSSAWRAPRLSRCLPWNRCCTRSLRKAPGWMPALSALTLLTPSSGYQTGVGQLHVSQGCDPSSNACCH